MKPSLHGYTKFPNWLFPMLPELSPAGMRVVMAIVSESISWGYEAVVLSNTDLMRLSGLARSSVQDGIKDAMKQQVIERQPYQQGFAYRVKSPAEASPFPWASLRHATWAEALDATSPPPDHQTTNRSDSDGNPTQNFALRPTENQAPGSLECRPEEPDFQTTPSPDFRPEGQGFQAGGPDFQPSTSPDFRPVQPDFQAGGQEIQARGSPISGRGVARNSGYLSAITDSDKSDLCAPKEYIQENTQELCEHTHNGSHSPRAREAKPCVCASRYRYDEVLAYAQSLKGIRNPGGLAVVYWRSGEMDEEIARFQQRQAEIAAQQATEAAEHEAELRALAIELRTRGEPLAEWEREIIAAFADEFEEEPDVQIYRLDVAEGNVV